MIIACSCGARLKIADEKLTAAGVRIKCPKCGTAHVARPPAAAPAPETTPPLPRPAAAPEPQMPWFAPAAPGAAAPPGIAVLVAHDSAAVAELIDGVLKTAGMSTLHATNGLEALKLATETNPQAMVVDVGLTGIYGFELCERLKSDPRTRRIKIILLSSVYGLTAYKRSPMTLYGADDYIEKHHIPDQLVAKLQRLLDGAAADAPAPAAPAPAPATAAVTEVSRTPAVTSMRGVLQEQPAAPAAPPQPLAMPEIPSILPKTPVTLGTSPKRPPISSPAAEQPPQAPQDSPKRPEHAARPAPAAPAAPVPPEPAPRAEPFAPPAVPPAPVRQPQPAPPAALQPSPPAPPATADASVKLDAAFFEQEEYAAPAAAPAPQAEIDPAEVEKARRFARLIVSDIALYNQEAVAEGVREGTLFDLLKDDIVEGRSLYEKRVPEAIRASKDYLQEAFDNFITAQKKLH
ncbi:MAG: zinc-ribbon domain-containing protein [Nitrospiraceae bacterium]|nr:zinc-ribbon domain-containing protein [Nitrospiraceae bacterium]